MKISITVRPTIYFSHTLLAFLLFVRIFAAQAQIDWTSRPLLPDNILFDVAFGAGKYVAVGQSGMIRVSTDGITWDERSSPVGKNRNLRRIIYANGFFVVVGDLGTVMTSTDGLNWFNYRRAQLGVGQLTRSTLIDKAALAHSNYQNLNGTVTHDEKAGSNGFTGVDLAARLNAAGYTLTPRTGYAIGEVISGTTNKSGVFMSEELITAIYHRFVAFEPVFKELGGGTATSASGYTYFTTDFGAINGYGTGITGVVTWPYNGQTGVIQNFLTDNEEPDALPDQNEAGYPVSVHANINATVSVTAFTIRQRGASSDLSVRLLSSVTDSVHTGASAAAIVPLSPLKAATTYDVTFVGNVTFTNGVGNTAVNKTWSFTTK